MLHHIMLNRHPSRTQRQRECQDSQALTDPLTERTLIATSWYLSVGFTSGTSGTSGEATYSVSDHAGLVCTMMNVFE